MIGQGRLARAVRWRLGSSLLTLVTVALAVAAATVAPLYLRAAGDSLVRSGFASATAEPGRGEPDERPGLGVPRRRRRRRKRGREQFRTVSPLRSGPDDSQQWRGPGLGPAPVRVCPFFPYRGVHRAPPRVRALPDVTGSGDAERPQCLRVGSRAGPGRGRIRPRPVHPGPASGERHLPGAGPDPPVLVESRAERLSLRDQQPSARPAARSAHHYSGDGRRRPGAGRTAHHRPGPGRNHQRRSDNRGTAATGSATGRPPRSRPPANSSRAAPLHCWPRSTSNAI